MKRADSCVAKKKMHVSVLAPVLLFCKIFVLWHYDREWLKLSVVQDCRCVHPLEFLDKMYHVTIFIIGAQRVKPPQMTEMKHYTTVNFSIRKTLFEHILTYFHKFFAYGIHVHKENVIQLQILYLYPRKNSPTMNIKKKSYWTILL